MSKPTWVAVVSDRYGYVLTDEEVRAWCADPDERGDSTPEEIAIVTASAKPENGERMPSSYFSNDRFYEVDIDYLEPDEVLRWWERAVAVTAAMNAAGVE